MELKVSHLSFQYTPQSPMVLQDVNFSIHSGERVGIFAPSGYGKSTLAKLLAGMYTPTGGKITLDGKPIPKSGIYPVQLIYQHPEQAINPRWQLKKVLEECGTPTPELLGTLGIRTQWLTRYPHQLSGGELQRFSIARALMSQAPFLICDEISTMLDVVTQAQIWRILMRLASENQVGLLVVTHNMALAEKVCTRVYDLTQTTHTEVNL